MFYLSFSTSISNPLPVVLFSRIWFSAQYHIVLVLLLNLVGFFIFTPPKWSGGNVLYHWGTSFEGASRGDQPFNIIAWFMGPGGGNETLKEFWAVTRNVTRNFLFNGFAQKVIGPRSYTKWLWITALTGLLYTCLLWGDYRTKLRVFLGLFWERLVFLLYI